MKSGPGKGWHGENRRHRWAALGYRTVPPRRRYVAPARRSSYKELGPLTASGSGSEERFEIDANIAFEGARFVGSLNISPCQGFDDEVEFILEAVKTFTGLKALDLKTIVAITSDVIEIAEVATSNPSDERLMHLIGRNLLHMGVCLTLPLPPNISRRLIVWCEAVFDDPSVFKLKRGNRTD